jgi:hypothetical protein
LVEANWLSASLSQHRCSEFVVQAVSFRYLSLTFFDQNPPLLAAVSRLAFLEIGPSIPEPLVGILNSSSWVDEVDCFQN